MLETIPQVTTYLIYYFLKFEKRYENNLNALKKKQPTSLTAKNDVENF